MRTATRVAFAAAALQAADAFTGPAPIVGLRLRGARAASGAPVAMKAAGDGAQATRKAMAAALASVILSAPLGGVEPAFAQDQAQPSAVVKADKAEGKEAGGVQNWRYSEFMTAVSSFAFECARDVGAQRL
jgi:hypothetical protein